ncbi:unnamed protein product [Notodromas monacha]|uniref:GOLD domain-containing protein n=1 Tax=Notodromas monacha TaxID=399045 RepID=A0A7R9BUM6_9CRUS|nr:unnamed protein product [Notodromas monacha]CAG0922044.1 unnamed protein product [Notodromas monacha]
MRVAGELLLLFMVLGASSAMKPVSLSVKVQPRSRDCFYVPIVAGKTLFVSYEVLDGGMGELDIDFLARRSSDSAPVVYDQRAMTNEHEIEAVETGEVELCFDNSVSHVNAKTVWFDASLRGADGKSESDDLEFSQLVEDVSLFSGTVEDIKEAISVIRANLARARSHQETIRTHEARDRNIAENNYNRVNSWSVFQLLLMLLVGTVQVSLWLRACVFRCLNAMGLGLSKKMDENLRKQQDFTIEMQRTQLERQAQMQNLIRERNVALQIAKSRELFFWWSAFYAITSAGLLIQYRKQRRPVLVAPLLPLTFIFAYQADLAYGNKLLRIRAEAESIMQFEKNLVELPYGVPTTSAIDQARMKQTDDRRLQKYEEVNEEMRVLSDRISEAELMLNSATMPEIKRVTLEKELNALKDLLDHHRHHLRELRSVRNSIIILGSFLTVAIIVVVFAYQKYYSFQ